MSGSEVRGGFAGRIAFVDLTSGRIEIEAPGSELAEKYVGAEGISTRLIYDRIPRHADPLGPDNLIVFGAGTFTGTMAPAASRLVIHAKSPTSNTHDSGNAGVFVTRMKGAGFDYLAVSGKAPYPVYIHLHDGQVSIEDARDLWGLDTHQTPARIWGRYPEASVICIGPAGELLNPFAIVIGDRYCVAGMGGMGAVMGSKNLKAVVASGKLRVPVANFPRFMGEVRGTLKEMTGHPYALWWRELGNLVQFQPELAGRSATIHYGGANRGIDYPRWTQTFREHTRPITCEGCPVACKKEYDLPEHMSSTQIGCVTGTVEQSFMSKLGAGISQDEWEECIEAADLGNRLGLNLLAGMGAGYTGFLHLKWAIEMFEQGVFTKEDTGGLELRRGNAGAVQKFVEDFALMRNFAGKLVKNNFEEIKAEFPGNAAVQNAMTHQGRYLMPWDKVVAENGEEATARAGRMVGAGLGHSGGYGSGPTIMLGRSADSLVRYGRRIGIPEEQLPEVFTGETDGYDPARFYRWAQLYGVTFENMGICNRPLVLRAYDMQRLANIFTHLTGIEMDVAGLQEAAERTLNLQRLFHIRELGLEAETESRYPPGYHLPEDDKKLEGHVRDYYLESGWDVETGLPKEETLRRLGIAQ